MLKVAADGKATVVARSPNGWAPAGGMIERNGNLWLLEYSTGLFKPAETCVRRIDREGQERVFCMVCAGNRGLTPLGSPGGGAIASLDRFTMSPQLSLSWRSPQSINFDHCDGR